MTKSQHAGLEKKTSVYTLLAKVRQIRWFFWSWPVIGAMNNGNIAAYNNGLTELQIKLGEKPELLSLRPRFWTFKLFTAGMEIIQRWFRLHFESRRRWWFWSKTRTNSRRQQTRKRRTWITMSFWSKFQNAECNRREKSDYMGWKMKNKLFVLWRALYWLWHYHYI